ncbi:lysophospholipid acyltransferase family protein [Alkalicoccus saliphilus]|uniref:Glycerol acyltransferase n=1 Tax=Alkalicoccus saliphilus TaxID=200989 RepID=A0A2T4UAL4_9BACI|nr:lysophospholipid acyltransferase family protein [Alkalicoccus saliphilus]PTL40429.1 glycerol acyltransferase [Alkalicoccus saliphilus]
MMRAENSKNFEKLFSLYNNNLLKNKFHGIYNSPESSPLPEKGSIIIMNHSSWWDPLILFYLNSSKWKTNGIAMMDEKGLNRFPFFSKLGAFSVKASSPASVRQSLKYAAEELRNGRHLFLFPQGKEVPLEHRPLAISPGTGYLKFLVPEAPVVPVAFYHGLFHHQMPEWYIQTGAPVLGAPSWGRKRWTQAAEEALEKEMNSLRNKVLSNQPFIPLMHGREGTADKFEKWKKKLGAYN